MRPLVTPRSGGAPSPAGLDAAWAAAAVGLLFAGVSLSWALGSTWLLDTVGGDLAERADSGSAVLMLVAWGSAGAKTVAAALPLLALGSTDCPRVRRILRGLSWAEAVVLTSYGLVLTCAGLLVQGGAIDSTGGDRRALAWHAYLWDPWFLVWGLLVTAALWQSRRAVGAVTRPLDEAPERVASRPGP